MPKVAERYAMLDPRQYRTWGQRAFAVLAVVCLLAAIGLVVFGQQLQQGRWDDAAVCSDEVTSDCLTRQEGHLETRGTGDERTYYFESDDGDRTELGTSSSFGRQVDSGLYDGDDLVAVEDFDGDRRYVGGLLSSSPLFLGGAIGALLLSAGCMFLLRRSLR
ncbi:MAG TPA: hypothetical protein VFO49_07905 [Nocardioides sp.]|nr:hypothetical protein [Nocardioides sp.]